MWYSLYREERPVIFGITATYHRQFPSLRIVWRRSQRSFNRSWQFDLRTNLCEARQDGDDIPVSLGKWGRSSSLSFLYPPQLKIQRRQSDVDRRWKRTIRARVSFRSRKAICKLSPPRRGVSGALRNRRAVRALGTTLHCQLSRSMLTQHVCCTSYFNLRAAHRDIHVYRNTFLHVINSLWILSILSYFLPLYFIPSDLVLLLFLLSLSSLYRNVLTICFLYCVFQAILLINNSIMSDTYNAKRKKKRSGRSKNIFRKREVSNLLLKRKIIAYKPPYAAYDYINSCEF